MKILISVAKLAPTAASWTRRPPRVATDGHRRLHGARKVRGQAVDRRADVFAFAQCSTKCSPAVGRLGGHGSDTLSAILRDEPPLLTEIDRTILPSVDADRQTTSGEGAREPILVRRGSGRCARSGCAEPSSRQRSLVCGSAGVASLDAHDGDGARGCHGRGSRRGRRLLAGRSIVLIVEVASIVALPAKVYGADGFHYLTDVIPVNSRPIWHRSGTTTRRRHRRALHSNN